MSVETYLQKYDQSHKPLVQASVLMDEQNSGYLCGVPYLWTTDQSRAFVFASPEDADEVWRRFFAHKKMRIISEKKLAMAVDPLVKAQKKAYRASSVGKLDKLLEEESRWKRKVTIASNKLAAVRRKINEMAADLAKKEVAP